MSIGFTPYFSFDGHAREAMEFYQKIFGGHLILRTFAQYDVAHGDDGERIMHAQLITDTGFTVMGADSLPSQGHPAVPNGRISLSGDDVERLRHYFDQLAEGGQVITALTTQQWGDLFGTLVDRFGNTWMVTIAVPQDERVS
ncbi:hypothetical protein KEM60_01500 [Austwickia sp. TVS 96-490-7B]|uniref:VOC family protein n=1 Tax=Austwickia sp. TVS 96-490-7B TaxID=2830843 RepID=UPI001C57AFF9|nr:VOC family protein [Austwickia sp. TVS 96-490-7B]MBW3085303.1 hypothetical protein [Austwickia sp. TVS 96-490-7B]